MQKISISSLVLVADKKILDWILKISIRKEESMKFYELFSNNFLKLMELIIAPGKGMSFKRHFRNDWFIKGKCSVNYSKKDPKITKNIFKYRGYFSCSRICIKFLTHSISVISLKFNMEKRRTSRYWTRQDITNKIDAVGLIYPEPIMLFIKLFMNPVQAK